jgi:hypothetical protein
LNDLENTYLELVGGKQWHGIRHAGMDQGSSFLTLHDNDEARALAAKLRIPWDEWVKIHGVCHYCHKKGHIHPKCPKYLAGIASGKIKRNNVRDNTRFEVVLRQMVGNRGSMINSRILLRRMVGNK